MSLHDFANRILHGLPPETAHNLAVKSMEMGLHRILPTPELSPEILSGMHVEIPGIGTLNHPIGLAAGFDKDLRIPQAVQQLGFSFLEAGTVTPKPQSGNPKPRLFRLSKARSLINRMGFNSEGMNSFETRLKKLPSSLKNFTLGINCGKNRDTPNHKAIDDYICCIQTFQNSCKYLVANLSSPNTEGLRDLASENFLEELAKQSQSALPKLWIKLDPDRSKISFQQLIQIIQKLNFAGIILNNTHRVEFPERGGMSGQAINSMSTSILEWSWEVHQGKLPTISVGGISTGQDVLARIERGAHAVQLYTALVYRGPKCVYEILQELHLEMKLKGIKSLKDFWGQYYL